MLEEDTNNSKSSPSDTSLKEDDNKTTNNLTSIKTSYTSGSLKEINYVASNHPARRERSVNLQIFSFVLIIDVLIACLLIGVFWYLAMSVPMYISIGIVSFVALIDLIFLVYTLIVYAKKIKREDERLREERYKKYLQKQNSEDK